MLADKHTRNACLLSNPYDQAARGVPNQDTLVRTPLWLTIMKKFPSGNGTWDPKQAEGNDSGQLAQSSQVLICPPPLLGHHPMVTSLLDWSEVIIRLVKDGDGRRTIEFGPIVTMSGHPWDSNAKDLFCSKKPKFHLISTFDSSELTLTPFAEPSRTNEPPIPFPSPSSKPHEDVPTCGPEPEMTPTQSMEEPFAPSSPHSRDEARQEFTDLRPTLMIAQAIIHESINQILLEHCQFLHMIPFMDVTHPTEMHQEFREEQNSLLGQALEAYPKEDITGIVSKYLDK
ncbi:hypothetical protein O181_099651 [Austropuccinia psidii MF-1]|uniref:Uncharacterized protein n=1 Tax=Austropuccinia psidii MF-1 TaxID=1389203 RepID=A0A9Q3JDV2_9BASI|nr:hypothetical protein [Austropuccinia psidii MF-1]